MNMKEMQDKAQRKQVWNTGFPDIAALSRVLSSKIFFELVELTDRNPLFICDANHYLSDLWPAFGCFIIRFIMSVGSDSIKVLLNPAGNDFEFSHSIHWSDILISYQFHRLLTVEHVSHSSQDWPNSVLAMAFDSWIISYKLHDYRVIRFFALNHQK